MKIPKYLSSSTSSRSTDLRVNLMFIAKLAKIIFFFLKNIQFANSLKSQHTSILSFVHSKFLVTHEILLNIHEWRASYVQNR